MGVNFIHRLFWTWLSKSLVGFRGRLFPCEKPIIQPEQVPTILKTDSFNLQLKAVNHMVCQENTQATCKSLGQRLVVYKLFSPRV